VIEQGIIEDVTEDVQTLIAARSQLDEIFHGMFHPGYSTTKMGMDLPWQSHSHFIPSRLDG